MQVPIAGEAFLKSIQALQRQLNCERLARKQASDRCSLLQLELKQLVQKLSRMQDQKCELEKQLKSSELKSKQQMLVHFKQKISRNSFCQRIIQTVVVGSARSEGKGTKVLSVRRLPSKKENLALAKNEAHSNNRKQFDQWSLAGDS